MSLVLYVAVFIHSAAFFQMSSPLHYKGFLEHIITLWPVYCRKQGFTQSRVGLFVIMQQCVQSDSRNRTVGPASGSTPEELQTLKQHPTHRPQRPPFPPVSWFTSAPADSQYLLSYNQFLMLAIPAHPSVQQTVI